MLNPSPASTREVAIDHERVRFVDPSLFTLSFVNDCRTHSCRCRDENDRLRADACCQHGADLYLPEKLAILRRTAEIQSVLNPDRRATERWFDEREPGHEDGIEIIRVATSDMEDESSGCVFLGHGSGRGCGLHVAALKHGFDPAEIKPSVCRLYPLSLDGKRLGISDDFDRYSCANAGETSIYRAMRETLGQLFGADLLRILDQIERSIEVRGNGSRESASHESASRRLRVVG